MAASNFLQHPTHWSSLRDCERRWEMLLLAAPQSGDIAMHKRQVSVTADNRGPLVNLGSWITLVVMCLAALTKTGTKLRKIGKLQRDDILMLAAMVQMKLPLFQTEPYGHSYTATDTVGVCP